MFVVEKLEMYIFSCEKMSGQTLSTISSTEITRGFLCITIGSVTVCCIRVI